MIECTNGAVARYADGSTLPILIWRYVNNYDGIRGYVLHDGAIKRAEAVLIQHEGGTFVFDRYVIPGA